MFMEVSIQTDKDFLLTSRHHLVHLPDQRIDVILPIAQITTLDVMLELPGTEAARGVAQLEGPEEIAGLLEVGSHGEDLVDEIFHAHDAVLTQARLDQSVVGQGNALLVDLAVATLVDELSHRLEIRIAVGNVRFDHLEHLRGCLGDPDKDAVVDLQQPQKLEDLPGLGSDLVDTVAEKPVRHNSRCWHTRVLLTP